MIVAFKDRPNVVELHQVSKRFVIRTDNSIKDRIVSSTRSREHRRVHWALRDIDFAIQAGTTVGLLGPNGSGKSTLLKIIGGILAPTTGEAQTRGRIAALIELGAGFHPDLSGRENVYLNAAIYGLSKEETDAQFDQIVEFSGVGKFIDMQVKFYSSGMYVRLAFSVAVHTDPDILLIDEVLAVGDEDFQRKCMDKIREFQEQGRTIVLVSHSSGQVLEVCDRTVVIADGDIQYDGDPETGVLALNDVLHGLTVGETKERKDSGIDEPFTVETLHLTNLAGAPITQISFGDPFVIEMHVRAHFSLDTNWLTGFSINTPIGAVALASNSNLVGAPHHPVSAGDYIVRYQIDSLLLGAGDYFINANASKADETCNTMLWQGAWLTVKEPVARKSLGITAAQIDLQAPVPE